MDRNYTTNGLNQYSLPEPYWGHGEVNAGPAAFTYDGNGNLISDGTVSFQYDVENRLVRAKNNSNGATTANVYYDPLGRLYNSNNNSSAGIVQYLYDGDALIAEFDGSNTILREYAHGSGVDDPVYWLESNISSGSPSYFLQKDHQGSVIAVNSLLNGPLTAINGYDAYGIPNETNQGRFQYSLRR